MASFNSNAIFEDLFICLSLLNFSEIVHNLCTVEFALGRNFIKLYHDRLRYTSGKPSFTVSKI